MGFKVGDKVKWIDHYTNNTDTGYNDFIEAGKGIIVATNEDGDNRNYEVRTNDGGEEFPDNDFLVLIKPKHVTVEDLNGSDIGSRIRVPVTNGMRVEGTLSSVQHNVVSGEVKSVLKFKESSDQFYPVPGGKVKYV